MTLAACDGDTPVAEEERSCRLVIGTLGDLSGPTASIGVPIFRGVELAVEEAVAEGRLDCDLELQIEDTTGDPDMARERARSLSRNPRLVACMCGYTSDEAVAAGAVLSAAGIPASGPATSPAIPGLGFETWFAAAPDRSVETEATVTYVRDVLGPDAVAVMDDGSTVGVDQADAVAEQLGDLVAARASGVDVSAAAPAEIVRAQPQVVYIGAAGGASASMAKKLRAEGLDSVIVSNAEALSSPTPGEIPDSGFLVACGCVDATVVPEGEDFAAAYQAAYEAPPGPYSAEMYDVTRLVLDELAAAGAKDSVESLRGAILEGFEASAATGVSGTLRWGDDGRLEADPDADVWVYEWRGSAGAFTAVGPLGDLR